MKISGMRKINEQLREESRKRAGIVRESANDAYENVSRGGGSGRRKQREIPYRKYIFSISFLILSLLLAALIMNWRSVNDLIDALDITDPVNSKVISVENMSDGIDRTLLVLTSGDTDTDRRIEDIYILSHNEQKGDRVVIYIPGEVYIPLANKEIAPYSSISNLHYAGETIKPGLGTSYAIWEIEEYIGYQFDSYLWLENEARVNFEENMGVTEEDDAEEYFSKIVAISNPIYLLIKGEKILDVSDSMYSNLDSRDIFNRLSKFMMNTFAEVNFVDFSDGEYIEKEALATGDEVPFLKQSAVDEMITGIGVEMLDKEVEKEQTKIEVYNGSLISGLAGRFSRALQNNGLNVIRVDNSDEKIPTTKIYVSQPSEYENSLNMVKDLMSLEPEIVEGRPSFLTTADIIVVLGEDNADQIDWLFD